MTAIWTFACWILLFMPQVKCQGPCSTQSDPCLRWNTREIPYLYSRDPSIYISADTSDNKYCDLYALDDGVWYISDFPMTNRNVTQQTCGTKYPLWMNGTHPEPADGAVNRTACIKTLLEECAGTYNIMAKNCTYYNVYCFRELPKSCPQRYCFDVDNSKTTTTTTTTTSSTTAPTTTANQLSLFEAEQEECAAKCCSNHITIIAAVASSLFASVCGNIILGAVIYKTRGKESSINPFPMKH